MARQSREVVGAGEPSGELLRGTLESMVLRVLADGPDHGYGVGQQIERALGTTGAIEDGSLYPALYRLERRRLISGSWGRSEANRRARFYALTPKGRATLAARTRQWTTFAQAVSRLLDGVKP